ncbi:hypothetical protein D3C85_1813060 [compost metagenome]
MIFPHPVLDNGSPAVWTVEGFDRFADRVQHHFGKIGLKHEPVALARLLVERLDAVAQSPDLPHDWNSPVPQRN